MYITQGGEKYQAAYYVFEELAQASATQSVQSLVSQAVAELHLGRLEEAEAALKQAQELDQAEQQALDQELEDTVEPGEPLEELDQDAISAHLDTSEFPDPDVIIRTGQEHRLSNFLVWQSAYSELVFMDVLWPDFGEPHLKAALETFSARERRFGGLSSGAA